MRPQGRLRVSQRVSEGTIRTQRRPVGFHGRFRAFRGNQEISVAIQGIPRGFKGISGGLRRSYVGFRESQGYSSRS